MQRISVVVATTAAAALAVGSFGMASADSHAGTRHGTGHSAHGRVGENAALSPQRSTDGLKKLVGIVNSDREIEISDRTPRHGRYKVVVRDSSPRHNWHLYGNGTSIATSVRRTGRWVFKIRLTVGNYRVICDPHYDEMEFDLIVH